MSSGGGPPLSAVPGLTVAAVQAATGGGGGKKSARGGNKSARGGGSASSNPLGLGGAKLSNSRDRNQSAEGSSANKGSASPRRVASPRGQPKAKPSFASAASSTSANGSSGSAVAAALAAKAAIVSAAVAASSSGSSGSLKVQPQAERIADITSDIKSAIESELPRIKELFAQWDTNGNGKIDRNEFKRAIAAVGVTASERELDAIFTQWDADGSGEIDLQELTVALRGIQIRRQRSADTIQKMVRDRIARNSGAGPVMEGGAPAAAAASSEAASPSKRGTSIRPSGVTAQTSSSVATKGGGNSQPGGKKGGPSRRIKRRDEMDKKEEEESHEWTASQWLQSLMLHEVLITAFDMPPAGAKQFNFIKRLSRQDLEERLLSQDVLEALIDAVLEGVHKLGASGGGPQDGAVTSDKFQTNAKFQMSYGSLSLFYGGLESLLGPPKMLHGSLLAAMEGEHTTEKDSCISFSTPNGVTTQSATEWEIVIHPSRGMSYPERDGYREKKPQWCRNVKGINDYMDVMERDANQHLRKAGHSELIKEELVGGRLYTGPMYTKYNTVLRAKSRDKYLVDLAASLTLGNDYVTTIHAINSCVLKLSKLTKAGKVWRGIKDAKLPKTFWVANSMGVRGGIEYGFSSTSTDKEQALAYAGGGADRKEGDAATIFEMQMGMVDRGANLTWLSQYPHEAEVLLPPLTGLEALDHTVEGGVLVIQSRLSLNMAAHTLEQVLSRRRKMLMDMCSGIELELRDQLDEKLSTLGIKMLNLALQFGPFSKPTEWFNDDENFAQVMSSTLRLQHVLQSEVSKLSTHMEKAELSFRGWREMADSRMLLLAGWVNARTSANEVAVDLRECRVTDAEGVILADILQRCPRLTSLDLRGNPTLGAKGIAALCQALRDEKPGHPRSLCGVSPLNTRLDVPRVFGVEQRVDLRLVVAELENHIYSESVTAGMGGKATGGTIQLNRRGGGGGGKEGGSGWQPLMWATRACHVQIAEQLIRNGAKVNEQEAASSHSNKYSPLHMACYKGHVEMTTLLLRSGADLTLKDVNGQVPKTTAEKKGFKEIVELLEQHVLTPLPPLKSEEATAAKAAEAKASAAPAPELSLFPERNTLQPRRQVIGGANSGGTPRNVVRGTPESTPRQGGADGSRRGSLTPKAAVSSSSSGATTAIAGGGSLMPKGAPDGTPREAAAKDGGGSLTPKGAPDGTPRATPKVAIDREASIKAAQAQGNGSLTPKGAPDGTPRAVSKLAVDTVKPVPQPLRTP